MLIELTRAGERAFRLLAKMRQKRRAPGPITWADAVLKLIEGN